MICAVCPISVVTYCMLYTIMTSCSRNVLVRVCLAIIDVHTLTPFSHKIFKHRQYWQKYFTWKFRQCFIFSAVVRICSRSSYLLGFHWHIYIKSTAYFFEPPCIIHFCFLHFFYILFISIVFCFSNLLTCL